MNHAGELIVKILNARGITDDADITEFLSDKPRRTFDPFLLPDMSEAADKLYVAFQNRDKICVYGDYDVDGVMASSLICTFLRGLALIESPGSDYSPVFYIPSRFDEGYGLNKEALRRIEDDAVKLVITVDCGSVSVSEVEYAREIGRDIIVTDHHEPSELLPDCLLVNPKRRDSAYPENILSGCGVAFKLMQALRLRYYSERTDVKALLNETLDLVAVATVADVVPLVSENRTFVKYGLKAINEGTRGAFRRLADGIGLKPGEISSYHIAFGIAPHINAAGRMESAGAAARLFLSSDEAEAEALVGELIRHNTERRAVQDSIYEECKLLVDACYKNDNFLLLRPSRVHEGVSGIVAGKIKSRFGRPVAVLSAPPETPGVLKASARSVPGIDITELLRRHEELFIKLGGHAMAAGFSLPEQNEGDLRTALNADIALMLEADPGLLAAEDVCELRVSPREISNELAFLMERFEPTGTENPRPLIEISRARVSRLKAMGEGGKHLRFNAEGVECVLFGHEELTELERSRGRMSADRIVEGMLLTLNGSLGVNWWNGAGRAQFTVSGISDV